MGEVYEPPLFSIKCYKRRNILEGSFRVGSSKEMSVVRCREAMSRAAESCLEVAEMAVGGGVVADRRVLSESGIYGM